MLSKFLGFRLGFWPQGWDLGLQVGILAFRLGFWAAAPKGRCPVGHRGEFPDVRKVSISGLRRLMEVNEDGYKVWRAVFGQQPQRGR